MVHKMGRTGIRACSHCRDPHPTRIAFILLMSRLGGGHPSAIHHDMKFFFFCFPFFLLHIYVCQRVRGNVNTIAGNKMGQRPTHDLFQVFLKEQEAGPVVGFQLERVKCSLFFFWQWRPCMQQTIVRWNESHKVAKKDGQLAIYTV